MHVGGNFCALAMALSCVNHEIFIIDIATLWYPRCKYQLVILYSFNRVQRVQ